MADNLSKTEWDAGTEVASDDIAGIHYPRVKLTSGADGTANDASPVNAIPVAFFRDAATHSDLTTTPLAGSGSYTSATFDTFSKGAFATCYIFADQGGTHIHEESHDGSIWKVIDQDPVTANLPFPEQHLVAARYWRARYVNGGSAQGTFYHQVIGRVVGSPHNIGISSDGNVIAGDYTNNATAPGADAQLVLSAIANAAAPSYTEGNVVLPRVTLAGDTAVTLDGESVTVTATNLDVRDLTSASDSVAAVSSGDVAHDAADSGNPISVGGIARTAWASVSAALDRVKATFDLQGRQIVRANAPRGLRTKNAITLTSTTETALLAAAASTFHDLTKLWISNTSATGQRVAFRDTTGGQVIFPWYVPAGQSVGFTDSNDPIEQTSVNTNWTAQLSAAVTDVRIFAQAVKNIA